MTLINQVAELTLDLSYNALFSMSLALLAIFSLMRHYGTHGRTIFMTVTGAGIVVLASLMWPLLVLNNGLPRTWLMPADVLVTIMTVLFVAFIVVGVLELRVRHGWQAFTNFTLAAGSITLALEFSWFAYGYDVAVGICVPLGWMLTILMAVTAIATRSLRSQATPAPAERQSHV